MSEENGGNTWPEQELVLQWTRKHKLEIPQPAILELSEMLTNVRVNYQGKLRRVREIICLEEDV